MKLKFSNKILLLILVAVAAVWIVIELLRSPGRGNLPELLASCDASLAVRIEIERNGGKEKVSLLREPDGWKIQLQSGKMAMTEPGKVENLLAEFRAVKPQRLAGTKESKWPEFKVDSSGARIKIFHEGQEEAALDLIAGSITTIGKNEIFTYVRLPEDEAAYTAPGMLIANLQSDESSWRNKTLLDADPWQIRSVTIDYPGDSTVILVKSDSGKWIVNGILADSLSAEEYVKKLSRTNHPFFADDVDPNSLIQPLMTATVALDESKVTTISVFSDPESGFLLRSSENSEAVFADQPQKLTKKIFVSQLSLMGMAPDPDGGHEH